MNGRQRGMRRVTTIAEGRKQEDEKKHALSNGVEDFELALSLRLPALEVPVIVVQLQQAAHLIDVNPGDNWSTNRREGVGAGPGP